MYIDELADIVDKYNRTYHRAIKMKPAEIGDIVRISKYKNIFAKCYFPS